MDAYQIIQSYHVSYKRLDSSLIQVETFGYCSAECIKMEEELKDIGVVATKRNYDKTTGKTITVYKQPSTKRGGRK